MAIIDREDYERCHWTRFERYAYAQFMRPATRQSTLANQFRARRSVFGDYPEVPFDAWVDMPDGADERMVAD